MQQKFSGARQRECKFILTDGLTNARKRRNQFRSFSSGKAYTCCICTMTFPMMMKHEKSNVSGERKKREAAVRTKVENIGRTNEIFCIKTESGAKKERNSRFLCDTNYLNFLNFFSIHRQSAKFLKTMISLIL